MPGEIVGATAVTPVVGGDKFRVTWEYWLSSLLPSWFYDDAPELAERVREWLPSQGFVPVSMPSASPGDKVIVFDVRLAVASWSSGRNVSQVLTALDNVPAALRVQRLQMLSGSETSTQLTDGQQDAITQGKTAADTNVVFRSTEDFIQSVRGALGTTAQIIALLAVAAIVAGGVYLYRESKG